MAWYRSSAIALLATVLLGGCQTDGVQPTGTAGSAQSRPTATKEQPALSINVPNDASRPVVYTWHGRSYPGPDAFLAAVQMEVAYALESVTPVAKPTQAAARMALPVRPPLTFTNSTNTVGVAEAQRTMAQFWRIMDDARMAALTKSQLFATVSSEAGNARPKDLAGADYAVWFDGTVWRVRYHQSNAQFFKDELVLATWLQYMTSCANNAKQFSDNPFAVGIPPGGGKVVFELLGDDYYSLEKLLPPLEAEYQRRANEVKAAEHRLGGKAKIVLATFNFAQGARITYPDPENTRLSKEGMDAQARAVARGRVQALRNAKIFAKIDSIVDDVDDVAIDGYDYVFWQPAKMPWIWHYHVAGKAETFELRPPLEVGDLQKFPDRLVEAVTAVTAVKAGK